MAIIDGPHFKSIQITAGRLQGATLDAAFPRATTFKNGPGFVLLKDDPLGPSFALTGFDTLGNRVWVTQGYGAGRWGKYVVGPANVGAPYQTIAAALAAAAADGYTGTGNPVAVIELLEPGVVEDVALPVNTALIGHGQPVITGRVVLAADGSGDVVLQNLAIDATAAAVPALDLRVPALPVLVNATLTNVAVRNHDAAGAGVTADAPGGGFVLVVASNCFVDLTSSAVAVSIGASATLVDTECTWSNRGTGVAVLVDGSCYSHSPEISGQLWFDVDATDSTIALGVLSAPLDLGAGRGLVKFSTPALAATLDLLQCALTVPLGLAMDVFEIDTLAPNPVIAGCVYNGKQTVVNAGGGTLSIASGTTSDASLPDNYGPFFGIAIPSPIVVRPLQSGVIVDGSALIAPAPVNLPSLKLCVAGQRVELGTTINSAFGLTVTPDAADSIDTNPAGVAFGTAAAEHIVLRAQPAFDVWTLVSY